MPSRSEPCLLRISAGHEESCCFRTILLPGSSSSAPGSSIAKYDLCGLSSPLDADGNRNTGTVVSTLISTSRLPRFLALVSSISTPPPALGDPPHVVKVTQNKGLGMFARREIQRGELIVWERPALIVPGLERNEEMSQEVFRLLAEGFLEVEGEGAGREIQLGSVDEIRIAAKERYEDLRRMAISSSFDGGHWLEGVVRTNALVLEFEDGQKNRKEDRREIYGGVYPLINRCNHSCVANAAVHFIPSLLTSCLYALRDIRVGEEITKSYVNPLLPRERRMQTLRQNYGFECDCPSCTLSPTDSTSSDERRIQLANILSTPTFTRWASDLARADEFLAEKHRWALGIVEEEQVWAVESILLEEMALACALTGDEDGFKHWARKIVDAGQWLGQVGGIPERGDVKEKECWRKWVSWLEAPEKRVKKWGWRRKMREEMSRRKSGIDLEVGMLDGIFGHSKE